MSTREQILDVAQSLIQSEGIDAVSFRTLADSVGVKSSSVHYHFSTKDDLLFELTDRYSAQLRKELQKISDTTKCPIGRIERLGKIFEATGKAKKICFCAALCGVSHRLDKRTKFAAQRFVQELVSWVETNIEIGQGAGTINRSVEAHAVAQSIVSLLEGALLLSSVVDKGSSLKHSSAVIRALLT